MLSSATKNTIKLTDHPLPATAVAIKLTAHEHLLFTSTLKIIKKKKEKKKTKDGSEI